VKYWIEDGHLVSDREQGVTLGSTCPYSAESYLECGAHCAMFELYESATGAACVRLHCCKRDILLDPEKMKEVSGERPKGE